MKSYTMKKILLVEDNLEMGDLVINSLKSIANVERVYLRKEVEFILAEKTYDLVIVDLNLPDCHGYEIYQMIRDSVKNRSAAIIFLTADDSEASQITGFTLGADDYILKPIKMGSFRARIVSKLKDHLPPLDKVVFGPIFIDKLKQKVILNVLRQEEVLDLTPIEYKILISLVAHSEKVVPRALLIDEAWGKNIFVGNRVVDQHVSSLRKKLGIHQSLIQTVYGTGYRLSMEISLSQKTHDLMNHL